MSIANSVVDEVDALKEHEKTIGRLYAAYACRFLKDHDFWLSLSREEDQHAQWLQSLRVRIEQEPSLLIVNRFPTAAINHSISYINGLIDHAHWPDLTAIKALSAALNLEQALLENRYFEVLAGDSAEVRHVLELLAQSTRTHLEKVQWAWRNGQPSPDLSTSSPFATVLPCRKQSKTSETAR